MNRDHNPMFLGARIWMVRFGTSHNSDTVNMDAPPAPPTASEPGPWVFMGKAKTFQATPEVKTAEVGGVGRISGIYETTELKNISRYKLAFSTNDMTPEDFELAFGLKDPLADGTEQRLFANAKGGYECWLYIELTDAFNNGEKLASMVTPGFLSLANPLQAQNDPALAEYEVSTIASPYATFNPVAITGSAEG